MSGAHADLAGGAVGTEVVAYGRKARIRGRKMCNATRFRTGYLTFRPRYGSIRCQQAKCLQTRRLPR